MRIQRLWINNFRGIRQCDWHLNSGFICLVGPGDSTKTSILDAIGLLLSRSNFPHFTDADFYNCEQNSSIEITAAITGLPDELVTQSTFGNFLSGIDDNGELFPEPFDHVEECLIMRLTVDSSLEPEWEVLRDDGTPPRRISAKHRQHLGFFRLGDHVDTHLRWSRPSALTAMSEVRSTARTVILDAHRNARTAVFNAVPAELSEITQAVDMRARELGSGHQSTLRAGLEPFGLSTGNALSLHHDSVPMTSFGTGTRRIVALSIQEQATQGKAILAIDEIEHGLEPHRLLGLLQHIKERIADGEGQTFVTTHSPVALESLSAEDLSVVRSENGETTITSVPGSINKVQGAARSAPSALLARSIVVGEGATEVGFIRSILSKSDGIGRKLSPKWDAPAGVGIVNGQGNSVLSRASVFANLGYRVVAMVDNDDRSLDEEVKRAEQENIHVIRCSYGRCFEEDLIINLNSEEVESLLSIVLDSHEEDSVLQSIGTRLSEQQKIKDLDPSSWDSFETVREAIARTAAGRKSNGERNSKGAWFKSESGGEQLAQFVVRHWETVSTTKFGIMVEELARWAHHDSLREAEIETSPS